MFCNILVLASFQLAYQKGCHFLKEYSLCLLDSQRVTNDFSCFLQVENPAYLIVSCKLFKRSSSRAIFKEIFHSTSKNKQLVINLKRLKVIKILNYLPSCRKLLFFSLLFLFNIE